MAGRINIGIVGCGELGRQHAEAFSRLPKTCLGGFCNRSLDKATALARRFGASLVTTEPLELIGHPEIDVVVIATHHDSHARLCVEAAKHKKHIVVEKPLALSVRECVETVNAVHAAAVGCMVAYKLRYYPTVQRARALIPQPDVLFARMLDDPWPDDYWAQDPVLGGGNVLSQGGHMVDLLCYLAQSKPIEVQALLSNLTHRGHPKPDHIAANIRFDRGSFGVWLQGDSGCAPRASKFSLELHGGTLRTAEIFNRLKDGMYRIGPRVEEMHRAGEEGLFYQNAEFIRNLRESREPACGPLDGLLATLLIERCLRAAQTGQAQKIEWDGARPKLLESEGAYTW